MFRAAGMLMLTGLWTAASIASQALDAGDGSSIPGNIPINLIFVRVDELAGESDAGKVAAALEAMKGVLHATADSQTKLVTVVAHQDAPVTAERVIQYLRLAGYEAAELSREQYDAELERTRNDAPMTMRYEAPQPDPTRQEMSPLSDATPVELVSLAESLDLLRERFNADKDKVRFIVLLSPT